MEGPPPSSYSSPKTGSPPTCQDEILSIWILWDPLSQLTKNQPTSPSLEPLVGPAFIIAHLDQHSQSRCFPHSCPHIHLSFLKQP